LLESFVSAYPLAGGIEALIGDKEFLATSEAAPSLHPSLPTRSGTKLALSTKLRQLRVPATTDSNAGSPSGSAFSVLLLRSSEKRKIIAADFEPDLLLALLDPFPERIVDDP
jgi:hypothetical protein